MEASMNRTGYRFNSIVVHVSMIQHSAGVFVGACIIDADIVHERSQDPHNILDQERSKD